LWLLLTEVRYDHEKSKAAKQEAKRAEIAGIEAYKKTHARKLMQASQLYGYDAGRSSGRAA